MERSERGDQRNETLFLADVITPSGIEACRKEAGGRGPLWQHSHRHSSAANTPTKTINLPVRNTSSAAPHEPAQRHANL